MISVIITTHDKRKEVCKLAIESVQKQTYKDIEIIVVDDVSRDGTAEMVHAISKKDKRVKYLRLKVKALGQGTGKNTGILKSKGEYIAFLDSDNTYKPEHLTILLKELENAPECVMVYGDRVIVENGKIVGPGRSMDFNEWSLMNSFSDGGGNYIDTSDVLVRREALFAIGGWDERHKRMLDWNLWARMVKNGYVFKHVPVIITNYNIHSGMISNDGSTEHTMGWDPINVEICLPYLGEIRKPKVAIFSLTYDRLDYSKKCFDSLYRTAGYEFVHFVYDNSVEPDTFQWFGTWEHPGSWCTSNHITHQGENVGISIASNYCLDWIKETDKFDIIVKADNDCLFLSDGWLAKMVDLWNRNHRMAYSCYIQGLRDNPGGAPRIDYGTIGDELIGITKHLGGICHFVDAHGYDYFRWDESEALHGIQDMELSVHLLKEGYRMGYLESYFAEHYEGTAGQEARYPEYFNRRKLEKVTKYEPKV